MNTRDIFHTETPRHKVIINSIPHCGTHLVSTILDLLGFKHARYSGLRFSKPRFDCNSDQKFGLLSLVKGLIPVNFIKGQPVALNWKTYYDFRNIMAGFSDISVPVSVGSPMSVRLQAIKKIISKVTETQYILGHVPHHPVTEELLTKNNWKGIFIIRDPRDMCLSMLRHIKSRPHHLAFPYLYKRLSSDAERIQALLFGYDAESSERGIVSVQQMYQSMMKWAQSPNFIMIRFEELIGLKGGGDSQLQLTAIRHILKHLDFSQPDNEEIMQWIAENAFGKSSTFRKGQIGSWRGEMPSGEVQKFQEAAGALLNQLGYENSHN